MSLVTEVSPEVIRTAAKVVASVELRDIKLVEGRSLLSPAFVKGGCRFPPKRWAVNLGQHGRFNIREKNILCTTIDFSFVAREQGNAKKQPLMLIRATFLAEYEMASEFKPSKLELKSFLTANATFNCWPYWREYVQSTVARMNLPPPTLPFFRVRAQHPSKPKEKHLPAGSQSAKQ